jgi:dihydrodipicolinate synthase/N-acetylneuraminate lyase
MIMADHGPMVVGIGAGAVAEAITRSQAVARFGALRATRLPPGMTIPDSTTPVNVIRRVVGATLGIDLPDVADSAYWSTLDAVDHFVPVDSLLSH